MKLWNLFSQEDLQRAVDDGYLNIRTSGNLSVLNYSDKASVDADAWSNPAVLNSRGLIIDQDYNVVARPWAKFFNYNQPQAGKLDFQAPVEVTDKADGSLIIIAPYKGTPSGLIASTRGSLESDQAKHAQLLLDSQGKLWDSYLPGDLMVTGAITPLFEVVYPGNRIILDYGGLDSLILLGGVWVESGDYISPYETARIIDWQGIVTAVMDYNTLQEALEAKPRSNAEGLVVRFLNENKLVKIKQEAYVRMHRALFGMNELRIWEAMMNDVPLAELLEPLPDEVHQWVRDNYEEMNRKCFYTLHRHFEALGDIRWEMGDLENLTYSRKEFAEKALEWSKALNLSIPVLFLLEDNKDSEAYRFILKNLRPHGGGDRPILEQETSE